MPMIFVLAFIMEFIAALIRDIFKGREASLLAGVAAGGLVGIVWTATSIGTNYLFARKSYRLFLTDAGYYVVLFITMGAILGAW